MKNKLSKRLDNQKIFKLVLGLGNQNLQEIEHLSHIYAKAGADMFDINPSKEAIEAVFRGIKKAGRNINEFLYSISTGMTGDAHIQKCVINADKCKRCGKCIKKCPRQAIVWGEKYPIVVMQNCIGCKKCDDCKAITFNDIKTDIEKIVEIAKEYNLDCVELHLSTKKIPDDEIKYIIRNFDGLLSLCLDRKYYSNERIKKLLTKVKKWNDGSNFIIQADGVPMSGGDNSYNSTLQAVAMAHLVQDYGTYIFLSGGTNEKTSQLSKMCSIRYNGIGVGSYARKIVKDKDFEDAVIEARRLIEACRND